MRPLSRATPLKQLLEDREKGRLTTELERAFDDARQDGLILYGRTVLRLTWDDVTRRPERVVRTIAQMLAISSRKRDASRPPDAASPYGG